MSVNKVILLGHIGADPEIRYPEPDRPIAFMSLATNDRYANSTTEITEWHRLVMGGPNGRLAENYIRKGTRLYVEGRIKSREYTDKMQVRRRITEIIVDKVELLGRRADNPDNTVK